MSESIESRVARLEEAQIFYKEDRIEARGDRKEIMSRLDGMAQTLQSAGAAITAISQESYGTRLNAAENRIGALERNTEPLPKLLPDLLFWQRAIGTGWKGVVRVIAFAISTGFVGILLSDWWHGR